jgi:hypothetical protein
VTAAVSTLAFTGCSHNMTVIKLGKLHIAWTSGTDGTVSSSEAEVTLQSTIFGASCFMKTGAGTKLGTLTGAKSSSEHATLDVNAVIPMGLCGDGILTGTYTLTNPTGLIVES